MPQENAKEVTSPETTIQDLKERIIKIETAGKILMVLAGIFGFGGLITAWMSNSASIKSIELKERLSVLESRVKDSENITDVVDEHVAVKLAEADQSIEAMSEAAVVKNADTLIARMGKIESNTATRYAANRYGDGHITTLGKHNKISIPVNAGDIVVATYTGSAMGSQFYYSIVDNNSPTWEVRGMGSKQIVMKADNKFWESITTQGVFKAKRGGNLQLEVEFTKSDVTGAVKVFGSSLSAINIGPDSNQ